MVPKCSWNVAFFLEGIKGTSWSQGFLHNLPDSCAPAFMGTCPRVRPTRLAQELAYRPVYSPMFMQELARSLSDLARPASMPALLASAGNVLVDILDLASPSVKETRDLLQWATKGHQDIRPIGVPKLETVAAFAATSHGYKVHDPHVKYMMALIPCRRERNCRCILPIHGKQRNLGGLCVIYDKSSCLCVNFTTAAS